MAAWSFVAFLFTRTSHLSVGLSGGTQPDAPLLSGVQAASTQRGAAASIRIGTTRATNLRMDCLLSSDTAMSRRYPSRSYGHSFALAITWMAGVLLASRAVL